MKILIFVLILFPALAWAQKHEPNKAHKHEHKDHQKEDKKAETPAPVTSPAKAIVKVNGMVCAFCAQGLEKKFKEQKEVDQISVDLEVKRVVVGYKKDQSLSDDKVKSIIKEAGFDVVSITKE